jgi:hypothetical protein
VLLGLAATLVIQLLTRPAPRTPVHPVLWQLIVGLVLEVAGTAAVIGSVVGVRRARSILRTCR